VRCANRIREFVRNGQEAELEAALEAQRSFWKFIGIVTLVSVILIGLIFCAAVAVGILARTFSS
jgi:hypothetical protein